MEEQDKKIEDLVENPSEDNTNTNLNKTLSAVKGTDLEAIEAKKKELLQAERISRAEFATWLAKHLKRDQVEAYLKSTSRGLFFEEQLFTEVIKAYQTWHSETRPEAARIRVEKVIEKLFGVEFPPLYYVILGKQAQSGFLLECEIKSPQKAGLVLYNGEPLEAINYLHPRDSRISNQADVTLVNDPVSGLNINFVVGKYSYQIDREVLHSICAVLRNSTIIRKKYPQIMRSYRDLILTLPAIFSKLRMHKSKHKLLIPSYFRNDKNLKYLTNSGLVFIIQGSVVKFVYQLKGSNRHKFITQEFQELIKNRAMRSLPCYIERNPRKYLASCDVQGLRFYITPKVFSEFLEQLPFSKTLSSKIQNFYTLADAFKLFVNLFKESSFIDSRNMERYLPRELQHLKLQGRIKDAWVFLYAHTARDHVIHSSFEYQKKEVKPLVLKPIQGKINSNLEQKLLAAKEIGGENK